ncbi:MAG: hypothetical protein LBH34_03560 [Prevotellaceae bacterium]|jgi:hypothetical protein|nr:hypothetical protein [Prevotellaceae bacterium]
MIKKRANVLVALFIVSLLLIGASCAREDTPYEIPNFILRSNVQYGFSVEQLKVVDSLRASIDFGLYHIPMGADSTSASSYFGSVYGAKFYLSKEFYGLEEGEEYFKSYKEVEDTAVFISAAKDLKPLQLWVVEANGRQIKLLTVTTDIKKANNQTYSEVTFKADRMIFDK